MKNSLAWWFEYAYHTVRCRKRLKIIRGYNNCRIFVTPEMESKDENI